MDERRSISTTTATKHVQGDYKISMSAQETYFVGRVGGLDSLAIVQEAHTGMCLALTIAVGFHQLLELCGTLDFEENLGLVLRNGKEHIMALARRFWVIHLKRYQAATFLHCKATCQ